MVSFVNAGFHATGVELSPVATKVAQEYVDSQLQGQLKQNFDVINADFFNLPSELFGKYDVVFDSTFLCAIQPDRRLEWASVMSKILKPGGILIQNVSPSLPKGEREISMNDDPGQGPPFILSVKLSKELMSPLGFTVVSVEDAPIEKISRKNSSTVTNNRETWLIQSAPIPKLKSSLKNQMLMGHEMLIILIIIYQIYYFLNIFVKINETE